MKTHSAVSMQNHVCLCVFNPLENTKQVWKKTMKWLTNEWSWGMGLIYSFPQFYCFIPVTRLTSCSLCHFGLGLEPHQTFDRKAWAFTSLADLAVTFLWFLSIQWRHSGLRIGLSCKTFHVQIRKLHKFQGSQSHLALLNARFFSSMLDHAVPDTFFAGALWLQIKLENTTYWMNLKGSKHHMVPKWPPLTTLGRNPQKRQVKETCFWVTLSTKKIE